MGSDRIIRRGSVVRRLRVALIAVIIVIGTLPVLTYIATGSILGGLARLTDDAVPALTRTHELNRKLALLTGLIQRLERSPDLGTLQRRRAELNRRIADVRQQCGPGSPFLGALYAATGGVFSLP